MASWQAVDVDHSVAVSTGAGSVAAALRSGMMETLGPREELVLRLRFGSAGKAHTREEVARLLDVSEDSVRRIERRALRKLRQSALGPISGGWQGWDEV